MCWDVYSVGKSMVYLWVVVEGWYVCGGVLYKVGVSVYCLVED